MVPISMDWPISTSSCFTIYSFARPISFFVAPLATKQISDQKTHSGTPIHRNKFTDTKFSRDYVHTFYSAGLVFLTACNIEASSQNGILIPSSQRFLIFYFLIYFICSILNQNYTIYQEWTKTLSFFFSSKNEPKHFKTRENRDSI